MRMLSSLLIGLVGLTACKTANFKGATGGRGKVDSPSTINSVDTVENPVVPGTGGTSTSTTNPDGSTTTTTITPDGTVTTSTKTPDGTTTSETTKPDGSVTTATTKPDGSTQTEGKTPDGTTTTGTKTPDGTTTSETKKPDGTVTTETKKPDGTSVVVTKTPEGTTTTETKKPDGSTVVVTKNPDGTTTTTTTTTTKDGTVVVVTKNPDGTTTTTTTTTKPDGTVTIVTKNPDGTTTTVTKNPSGTTPGKDPNEPIFVECPENPNHMLIGKLYDLPANSDKVPTFSAIQNRYKKEVCIKQLDVVDREFTQGFPGIPGLIEWFALDINWRVNVPEEGVYTFYINSDDGSFLYIDGTQVINNDGLHPHQEKQQTVKISKGWHNFHVTWYQGPRYRIALELFWKRPGAANREYIPTSYFARPSR
jgi:hypothetical protein